MVEELDSGPVYSKRSLSLEGIAEEIYIRSSAVIFDMIAEIASMEPQPVPQTGEPTVFRRRTPAESVLSDEVVTLQGIFDHIRMLDADGYPLAYLDHGAFRFHFRRPALRDGRVEADVSITLLPDMKTCRVS
jgi:methionyl-tRNA formyltransferase